MHTIIDQLISPSSVNFSRKFTAKLSGSLRTELLLLVKTNLVEVYVLSEAIEGPGGFKLKLISKQSFVARIESIEIISRASDIGNDSDWVCMSFTDCKMTIFEYQGLINEFVPRSLHFFERENYRTNSTILGTPSSFQPVINIDPENRMVSVRVFTSHLALLSLDDQSSIPESSNNNTNDKNNFQSHVINFSTQIDPRLKVVRNFVFLPGFLNPTIAILYDRGSNEGDESETSFPLRTSVNHCNPSHPKETCAILIVAIEPVKYSKYRSTRPSSSPSDSGAFQFTVVNCIEGIPFDAEDLYPLPKPVGGIFISCTNLLLWCDISTSTAPYSISINQFASLSYSPRINNSQFQGLNVTSILDGRFLALGADGGNVLKCLLITKCGEKLVLSISRSGRTLGFLNIEKLEIGARISPSPSDIIQLNEELIFVASEGGGSQLISLYSRDKEEAEIDQRNYKSDHLLATSKKEKEKDSVKNVIMNDDIDTFLYGDDIEMPQAPAPSANVPITDDDYLLTLEKEEAEMKISTSTTSSKSPASKTKKLSGPLKFELIDELESIGPIIDLAVDSNEQGNTEIVAIGGAFTDKHSGTFYPGSINILTKRIPPAVQLSFNLPDTRSIWTVNSSNGETKYLVASTTTSTLVLTTSQAKIVELEESDFYLEGPTFYCTSIKADKKEMILQVFPTGLRLLNLNDAKLVKDLKIDMNNTQKVQTTSTSIFILNSSDDSLHEFSLNLESVQIIPGVTTFTISENWLLISFINGSLKIINTINGSVLFENPLFIRLPVTLKNRQSSDFFLSTSTNIEVKQKIISLDLLITESPESSKLLIVRYECQKCVGIVTYCLIENNENWLLQRKTSEALGMVGSGSGSGFNGSSGGIKSESCVIENEVILYFTPQLDFPVITLGLNQRNFPRQHILLASNFKTNSNDFQILSLASYNRSSLMVLKSNGSLSIVDLQKTQKRFNLDFQSGWYLKQIGLQSDRVPTHIEFHAPSKTYLVASAEISSDFTLPTDEYAPISDNLLEVGTTYETGIPVKKLFATNSNCLHLINSASWTVVDELSDFLPYEGVTCIRSLDLSTQQTASGFCSFLTVGTAYQKGEDRPIRGRAFVFDVAEVVPEPGRPETNRKLRLKGITDFKGPVLAFTPLLQGHVVVSTGAKIIVNTFEEDEKFAGVAFHDIGTCTLALASLKNFFAPADLVNSVTFLAFQAEPLARIHELGRDFGQNLQSSAVEFVVNREGKVLMVTADDQGGLHFFSYAPNNLTTNSGQRLLDKGSFYLHGTPVNKLIRIPLKSSISSTVAEIEEFGVLATGQDGSLHLISPLADVSAFRRLFVLEMRLGAVLPAAGGLVSRVCRQVPRRMNVSHALPPGNGQYTVTLPTSAIRVSEDSSDYHQNQNSTNSTFTIQNQNNLNSTLILHHLPVSNSLIDFQAIKRFNSDSLCDGLARQILANRFGLDYEMIMKDIFIIFKNSELF